MDQITIDAARRGDRAAQGVLLRELADPWFRFCLSLLANPEDARDATQETALRVLRDLPRFRGDSSFTTWSIGIALNVTREMRRKIRDPVAATLRVARPGPEQVTILDESSSLVRSMLRELPDRQREAIVLRYFEELSMDETAAVMQCAVGTVKATVHQALRTLRQKLKQLA